MKEYDYEELVDRAKDKLPEDISKHERFQVPESDVLLEGKNSVFRNFGEIVSVLNRDQNEIFQFLQKELGTSGTMQGDDQGARVVFKGKIGGRQIDDKLTSYIENFVLCSECQRPDTRLDRDGRTLILACEACGARRPVNVKKSQKSKERDDIIKAGQVVEVMIQDVGSRGDGVARRGKYIIYVPGTAKGAVVKVKVEKVSGTRAFGQVVRE
ncbi:MAG: translation initiation factor IF-2 subunit beta [Candidatus Thermoplasmatota archaeon]|nr:translation initiation factor IF-2 subunit beta [Candidatus Thermoplasmatota archaeon]